MRLNVQPFKDVEHAKSWAHDSIDSYAGRTRLRYITDLPGQEDAYKQKKMQAEGFLASYPDITVALYPWIEREAFHTNLTPLVVATRIKAKWDMWNSVIAPEIEGLRVGAKVTISQMTDIQEILAFTRNVQMEMDLI